MIISPLVVSIWPLLHLPSFFIFDRFTIDGAGESSIARARSLNMIPPRLFNDGHHTSCDAEVCSSFFANPFGKKRKVKRIYRQTDEEKLHTNEEHNSRIKKRKRIGWRTNNKTQKVSTVYGTVVDGIISSKSQSPNEIPPTNTGLIFAIKRR